MCGGPEKSNSTSTTSASSPNPKEMNHLTVDCEDSFYSLLELASDNDAECFKRLMESDLLSLNKSGLWYVRQKGSKQVVHEHRTPLMVAATYGCVDVLKLILSYPEVDVNLSSGTDKSTALHCATSSGSVNAVDIVDLLLSAGADPNSKDVNGDRPVDVILVHPKLSKQNTRFRLEELLINHSNGSMDVSCLRLSIKTPGSESPPLSSSLEDEFPSPPKSLSSPKFIDGFAHSAKEKKEYPIDPSLPDIKNSIYATDEFRMFSFKVRPCSRAYSHDWTECPFVHPGENARRRDPRKFHYSCVPCPDFRKGACRRGDMCEYAHGVFECWLHPAQYRTRLCKDGTSCNRRVCFFAHTNEELRPLYVSTGSAVPSPRSIGSAPTVMDMATALGLLPGSPSSVSALSPSPFTQTMSPSSNGVSHSSMNWQQPNVPTLHLPGSNLQSSRLRSSLNARDMHMENLNGLPDFDNQPRMFNDMNCFSQPRPSAVSVSRSGWTQSLTPNNLEELFSSEISSSPRFSDPAANVFSPTRKSTLLNQFQQQQQSMLSPINTSIMSPKNVDHPMLQASFGVSSPGRMSPRSTEPLSPMGSRFSAFMQREKQQQHQQQQQQQHQQQQQQQQQHLRTLSSRELGSNVPSSLIGSPVNSLPKWGSPNGKVDWSVGKNELGHLRRSSSFEMGNNGEEPDLSWVQSLVKESPPEMLKEKLAVSGMGAAAAASGEGLTTTKPQLESTDHSVIGAWLEQMQLDQLVV